MSLLAAFVAMLGKQWLNRYLRHAGGSTVERSGDRQRKFDGLERWQFRLFVESLPIMLQIALLLLACGLSRYTWSVNTSVARVVISFTVLGILFYIGIVVAGASSYECPFQTPASATLRYIRDSRTTRRLLTGLSPAKVVSLIHATWTKTRKLLANTPLPNATLFTPDAWVGAGRKFVSISIHIRNIPQQLLSSMTPTSRITSGILNVATEVWHQTIILSLRIDRSFGNTKQRLVQGIRRLRHARLLPVTVEDARHQPPVPRGGPGLRVRVWNLEVLRRQNTNNERCVCWVLRNITDPEAIDSTIRLAGNIRWFDGDSDHDPPFDLIISAFESCFDSAKQPYPSMRDRAYFSARAILRINASARLQSHNLASKYPIPTVSSSPLQNPDPDLHHILRMLELNFGPGRPSLDFPGGDTNTHSHMLWVLNLFVDLARASPNPILRSYWPYLSGAVTNVHAVIANTLLLWYMLLGGRVEEETFWAVDKS